MGLVEKLFGNFKSYFCWKEKDELHEIKRKRLTLSYQLGYQLGHNIVKNHLPTFSCDTYNGNLTVSLNDTDEKEYYELLDNLMMDGYRVLNPRKLREFNRLVTKMRMKYLPEIVTAHMSNLNLDNVDLDDLKEGISDCLFDFGSCHYCYDRKDITIEKGILPFSYTITLKRMGHDID